MSMNKYVIHVEPTESNLKKESKRVSTACIPAYRSDFVVSKKGTQWCNLYDLNKLPLASHTIKDATFFPGKCGDSWLTGSFYSYNASLYFEAIKPQLLEILADAANGRSFRINNLPCDDHQSIGHDKATRRLLISALVAPATLESINEWRSLFEGDQKKNSPIASMDLRLTIVKAKETDDEVDYDLVWQAENVTFKIQPREESVEIKAPVHIGKYGNQKAGGPSRPDNKSNMSRTTPYPAVGRRSS